MLKKLNKFRKVFQKFKENFFNKEVNIEKQKSETKFDVFGKKIADYDIGDEEILNKEMDFVVDKLQDNVPTMQNRKQRFTSLFYLMGFMTWYLGVMFFIMYRVKGNDLDDLEKEAKEKIRISNISKEFN